MKKTTVFLAVLAAFTFANAADYIVIVNKASSASSVSASDLKRLYTGKMPDFAGKPASPANFALDNPAAVGFLKDNVGMSSAEYKSFWLAEQVRGGGSAPAMEKTAEAMLAYVSGNPGAIGYVPAGTATDAVKVLSVK